MTNWLYTDKEFRAILQHNNSNSEKQSVANTKKELLAHLKSTPCYKDLDSCILLALKNSTTFFSFNSALSAIYDYADSKKIWIDL